MKSKTCVDLPPAFVGATDAGTGTQGPASPGHDPATRALAPRHTDFVITLLCSNTIVANDFKISI